jgi:hypothetical protein
MIKDYEEDPSKERLVQMESETLNAELLIEGEMPIDMDLLYIYIPQDDFKYNYSEENLKKYPFLAKTKAIMEKQKEELENLIKEHPDLPWTRENPFK